MKILTNILISLMVATLIGGTVHYISLAAGCKITIGGVLVSFVISFITTFTELNRN